ncbi:MAG: DUF4340 domain-containing protein [Elusimicrobia bacterium]|nr:DUF4340 domain-containing protein [Elusimicrobiota bacterium]
MSKKLLAAMLGLFALLLIGSAGAHYLRNRRIPNQLWPQANPAAVKCIQIDSPDGNALLRKSGDAWQMSSPVEFEADQQAVERILEMLPKAALSASLTQNPQKHSRFEVDASSGIRLRLYAVEVPSGAPVLDFYLGKSASQYDATFFRRHDSDDVHEAQPLARYELAKKTDGWMDKRLMRLKPEEIKSVTLKNEKGKFTIAYSSDPASAATAMFKELLNMEAMQLLYGKQILSEREMGLHKPKLEIQVNAAPPSAPALTLQAGFEKEASMFYVRRAGENRVVYLIPKWQLDAFQKSEKEYR